MLTPAPLLVYVSSITSPHWRKEIGAARYDAMKQVLRQLGRDQIG